MIKGIDHVGISTGNVDRIAAFYRDMLGFKDVFAIKWDVGNRTSDLITGLKDSAARVVVLKSGDVTLEFFEFHSPAAKKSDPWRPACDHGISHICLRVEDIDSEYARLCAAGMEFNCPPQDVGGGKRATYGRDPDGNIVELLDTALESLAPFTEAVS
jgi:catechol 2,3-dioxygenase-like lactoylglutathione lyase family enzyme